MIINQQLQESYKAVPQRLESESELNEGRVRMALNRKTSLLNKITILLIVFTIIFTIVAIVFKVTTKSNDELQNKQKQLDFYRSLNTSEQVRKLYYPGMGLHNFTITEQDEAQWGSHSLPYINLTGNLLQNLVSCKLSTLLTLDMSSNSIKSFSRNTFPNLNTLILSDNQLEELVNNELSSLKVLLLDNNQLNDDAIMQLMNKNTWSSSLQHIDLRNNKITQVNDIKDALKKTFPSATVLI